MLGNSNMNVMTRESRAPWLPHKSRGALCRQMAAVCLVVLGVLVEPALAQTAPTLSPAPDVPAPLTLRQALQSAGRTHPNVISRQAELAAQRDGLESARWQRYPGASVSSSIGASGERLLTGRLEVPLWNAGRLAAEIDAAGHRVAAAEAGAHEAVRTIEDVVVAGFTELARTRDRIEAAEVSLAEHERLLALITRRVSSEVSAQADLVLAQARLSQARVERSQLDALAANARSALSQATGQVVRDVLVPSGLRLLPVSFETVAQAAMSASPNLRRGLAEEAAADAGIAALRAAIAWVPQEPFLFSASVAENIALRSFDQPPSSPDGIRLRRSPMRETARKLIEAYKVKTPGPDAAIRGLSGGNVQRAVLARELSSEGDLLIVANPCFGLDFAAVAEIRARIVQARNRGAAVLLVSEDLDEILQLSDRIVVMFDGRLALQTDAASADVGAIGRAMAGH